LINIQDGGLIFKMAGNSRWLLDIQLSEGRLYLFESYTLCVGLRVRLTPADTRVGFIMEASMRIESVSCSILLCVTESIFSWLECYKCCI
jgi:hypothetical protein